jgi:branched-chain amino acid aminotransferase
MNSHIPAAGAPNPAFLWRSGSLVPWESATVHVNAAGHSTVSSVFEGIKAYWNDAQQQLYVFRLREHMQRLMESIKIARVSCEWSLEEIEAATLELLRANNTRQDTYIRPWTFLKGIVREMIAPPGAAVELAIDTWGFKSHMLTERGCTTGVTSWTRIGDNSMPPRLKAFANYHNGRLALAEVRSRGIDWPIFLNDRHKVTEGIGACLAIVRNGVLITPEIASGILESITRDSFLRLLPEVLGQPVVEREVDRTELYVADEVFYMGTGWEILPILSIDGLPVGNGKMGPVAHAMDRVYHDVVRGTDARYPSWRTPVWS